MKTILHVIESLGRGGAERVVINNINLFDDYRHVICILHGPEELKTELKTNVPVVNLNVKKTQLFSAVRLFRKVQVQYRIDIVHAHLLYSSWVARIGKLRTIPLVNTLHSHLSEDAFEKNRWSRFMEQITANRVDCMIGVSRSVLDDYTARIRYRGAVRCIYNYNAIKNITPAVVQYIPGQELKLVCVGSIKEAKNYSFLLHALADLPLQYRSRVQIDVYGTGPMEDALKKEAKERNVPVRFMGSTSNVREIYSRYDAFCMCSRTEGMPMSLLEASDAGLPLLLSDIGIFAELAKEHALFFSLKKTKEFCEHLVRLIDGYEDLHTLAAKSRQVAQKFKDPGMYIQQHYQVYSDLTGT